MSTVYGNPELITKVCEWTGKSFTVDWKHRDQRFINKEAMYAWRKSQNRETVPCLHCGKLFERYKRILHPTSGELQQYCSNECNRSSKRKKEKLRKWITNNNPMNDPSAVEKIKKTKLKKYGDHAYNNPEKYANTCMEKYGTACYFDSSIAIKSNGKRISKFQQKTYDEVLKKHPDAVLEKYLKDARCAVDIYVPSIKHIIECYGDYWHCNPSKCAPNYYNKSLHMTAAEVWDKDKKRVANLRSHGYTVDIIWENAVKKITHKEKPLYL